MTATATPYDRVAYPAGIFPQTLPARLAVLGHFHGLMPAPPATARVLEVGGGSGMNLIAMAAACPHAQFTGFDLAESAIEVGQRMIAEAGLTNVTLFAGDICDVADTIEPGGFDYIIAHGVYAWVPQPVRKAMLALYGRALSANGMGFISYNALPGGYIRMVMRDRMLDALQGIEGAEHRIAAARQLLEAIAADEDDELVEGGALVLKVIQAQAKSMLERPPAVLFHDELGPVFAPQRIADVAADAAKNGMLFLTDAGRNLNLNGFLPPDHPPCEDEDATVLRIAQQSDNEVVRFFRQSVFVRAGQKPARRLTEAVTERVGPMWLSANMGRNEDGSFQHNKDRIEMPHAELASGIIRAIKAYPAAVRVDDLVSSHQARGGIMRLFAEFYLELRTDPQPFATSVSERPETSPLARASIRLGDDHLLGLNHTILSITQPELRALLLAADGTHSLDELRALDHGIPADEVVSALNGAAMRALLVR
jgi:Methyltransferase domain